MKGKIWKNVIIEPMKKEDISSIREIEKQCFTDLWPEDSFERELSNTKVAFYFAAHLKGRIIGYMGAWLILDEVHITTLAVDPAFQNEKVGSLLVLHLMKAAVEKGVRWATLEVSEKNLAAIKVYDRFGFIQIGVRKEYYNNGTNALVLWAGHLQKSSYREKLEKVESELFDRARAL